jgi:uncharacterized membrane protein YqhA
MSQSIDTRASTPASTNPPPQRLNRSEQLVRNILSSSRYFLLLAITGSFIASCAALVYAWLTGINLLIQEFSQREYDQYGIKRVSVELIALVDLFLLGTVLYIIAAGIYQLFISPSLPLPSWLQINDLDDLKERLLSTVSVLLAVSFLGYVVTWDGQGGIVGVGIAVGVVLLALSLLLGRFRGEPHRPSADGPPPMRLPTDSR